MTDVAGSKVKALTVCITFALPPSFCKTPKQFETLVILKRTMLSVPPFAYLMEPTPVTWLTFGLVTVNVGVGDG